MSELKHTKGPWQDHHDHSWVIIESDNGDLYVKIDDLYVKVEKVFSARKPMAEFVESNPKRQPLSNDEIAELWGFDQSGQTKMVQNFARAIEKAHGIQ